MLSLLIFRCEAQFARRQGQTFRKKLPLDYKKGDKHDHRNTHALPLGVKDHLMRSHKGGNWKKIRELERQSLKPFGKFTRSGFIFQKQKLPFYDIPNLEGFELKPYVEYNAPKLPEQLEHFQQKINKSKAKQIEQKLP